MNILTLAFLSTTGLALGTAGRTWDENRSYELLGYAQASYCDVLQGDWRHCGAVCRGLPQLSNFTVTTNTSTDGLAFVGYDAAADHIVVSFRGTQATCTRFRNWWSDLMSVVLEPLPPYLQGGRNSSGGSFGRKEASEGKTASSDGTSSPLPRCDDCCIGYRFLNAYGALRSGVYGAIVTLRSHYPSSTVSVVRHSLEAALARIHALDLATHGIPLKAVVTFGSPRTGNKAFSTYYAAHVVGSGTSGGTRGERGGKGREEEGDSVYAFRVTHDRDPIVHLPPKNTATGSWHVPGEVFFTQQTGLDHRVCDGTGEDPACAFGTYPLPSTRDHLNYMDRHLGSYGCPK